MNDFTGTLHANDRAKYLQKKVTTSSYDRSSEVRFAVQNCQILYAVVREICHCILMVETQFDSELPYAAQFY